MGSFKVNPTFYAFLCLWRVEFSARKKSVVNKPIFFSEIAGLRLSLDGNQALLAEFYHFAIHSYCYDALELWAHQYEFHLQGKLFYEMLKT